MKGNFHGSFETEPSFPVVPVIGCVVAFAVVSALAVILLWLAVAAMVVIAVAVPAAVLMRRRYPDYSPSVAAQGAALRAEVTAPRAAPAVENHYHLHVEHGADLSGLGFEAFARDAVTERKEK